MCRLPTASCLPWGHGSLVPVAYCVMPGLGACFPCACCLLCHAITVGMIPPFAWFSCNITSRPLAYFHDMYFSPVAIFHVMYFTTCGIFHVALHCYFFLFVSGYTSDTALFLSPPVTLLTAILLLVAAALLWYLPCLCFTFVSFHSPFSSSSFLLQALFGCRCAGCDGPFPTTHHSIFPLAFSHSFTQMSLTRTTGCLE